MPQFSIVIKIEVAYLEWEIASATWFAVDLPYKKQLDTIESWPCRLRKGWRYATFAFSVPKSPLKTDGQPKDITYWRMYTLFLILYICTINSLDTINEVFSNNFWSSRCANLQPHDSTRITAHLYPVYISIENNGVHHEFWHTHQCIHWWKSQMV